MLMFMIKEQKGFVWKPVLSISLQPYCNQESLVGGWIPSGYTLLFILDCQHFLPVDIIGRTLFIIMWLKIQKYLHVETTNMLGMLKLQFVMTQNIKMKANISLKMSMISSIKYQVSAMWVMLTNAGRIKLVIAVIAENK